VAKLRHNKSFQPTVKKLRFLPSAEFQRYRCSFKCRPTFIEHWRTTCPSAAVTFALKFHAGHAWQNGCKQKSLACHATGSSHAVAKHLARFWGLRVLNALYCAHQPNRAVKPTPILAMASPFYWPVLVPCAPSVLRRRLPWALAITRECLEGLERASKGSFLDEKWLIPA
jgi:hypothetical protein